MDAANSPRTTRDALIYDLLGDVGRLEEKIKSLPATLNNALEPTKKELRDIQSNILKQIAALPGAADKEAKRANDAVISSLGKEVGRIAQQIAGNAAEATAAKAKTEAARWQAGALLVGLAVGAIGTYLAVSGAHAINMSTARDRVAAAELRAETAEAEAKKRADEAIAEITEKSGAAVAAVSARNTWAASATGQLAKRFFDSGAGSIAATCKSPVWEIKETQNGKFCVPKRRDIFGGGTDEYGWKIP